MLEILDQVETAIAAGAYMPALMVTLTLPDICGAVSSDNGRASGSKYRSWLVQWFELNAGTSVASAIGAPEAAELYAFRCSLLHQGSARPSGGVTRLAFIEPAPGAPQLHNLSTVVGDDQIGWISVPMFADEMRDAVSRWWRAFGDTTTVQRNYERYARRRPEGLPPHVTGSPVIA